MMMSPGLPVSGSNRRMRDRAGVPDSPRKMLAHSANSVTTTNQSAILRICMAHLHSRPSYSRHQTEEHSGVQYPSHETDAGCAQRAPIVQRLSNRYTKREQDPD